MLPHIITSNLEHGSVRRTAQDLADNGEIGKYGVCKEFVWDLFVFLELTVIKANPRCGHVLVEDVIGAIKYDQASVHTHLYTHVASSMLHVCDN